MLRTVSGCVGFAVLLALVLLEGRSNLSLGLSRDRVERREPSMAPLTFSEQWIRTVNDA